MALIQHKTTSVAGFITIALPVGLIAAVIAVIPLFILIFLIKDLGTAKAITLQIAGVIGALVAIWIFFIGRSTEPEKIRERQELLNFLAENDFESHVEFSCKSGMVAVNDDYSRLMIQPTGRPAKLLDPADLLEMVLDINDAVASKTTSGAGGSLLGAALGGVLTGGVGAIVGSVVGKNPTMTTTNGVNAIKIKMVVRGMPNPLYVMTMLEGEHVWERTSMVGADSLKRANEWWAILTVFINRAHAT